MSTSTRGSRSGAFLQAGITRRSARSTSATWSTGAAIAAADDRPTARDAEVTEIYPDGSRACHQDLPYRPDFKFLGSYTLPLDIMFSGTYQFSRGVQTGGAGAQHPRELGGTDARSPPTLGRPFVGRARPRRRVNLMRGRLELRQHNLNQLDLRASKRFRFAATASASTSTLYNLFNSNWPFTVTTTFSTAATATWLRPTNVLQARFFKIGGQFDF